MAKLEVFSSKQEVRASNVPQTSTLALPLSLAKIQGEGIKSVTKAIGAIQKDLYAIQDNNQVNEVLPDINIKMQRAYEKYTKSLDLDAPYKLEKDLNPSNFEDVLSKVSKPVRKLLTDKIAEKKALLVPKLVGQISTNNVEQFTLNLDKSFCNPFKFLKNQPISSSLLNKSFSSISFKRLSATSNCLLYSFIKLS